MDLRAQCHDGPIAFGGTTLRQTRVAGFTLAEVTYAPHLHVPRHTHQHAHIGFLLTGACRETVRRRSYDYEPRHLIVKTPGESHSNQAGRRGTHFLIVDVGDDRCLPEIFDERVMLRGGLLAPLMLRLREELHGEDSASALAIEGLLLELLAEIARRRTVHTTRSEPSWLPKARELIRDCVAESLSLRSLAATVGVHPAHFARAFRQHVGLTPGQYLRGLRLERATRLLAETERPIAEIARECGFCDQSHLTNALKRAAGLTPAAYRRGGRAER